MRTVDWQDGRVRMIDQRRLPAEMVIVEYDDYRDVTTAIRDMVVRGAPAIGATGAFALALAAQHSAATTRAALLADLADAAVVIRNARPTASNLAWGVDRLLRKADATPGDADAVRAAVLAEAQAIADADVATNRRMGAHGAALVPAGATILHHCNTGALAAVDYGTALGVVRAAQGGVGRIEGDAGRDQRGDGGAARPREPPPARRDRGAEEEARGRFAPAARAAALIGAGRPALSSPGWRNPSAILSTTAPTTAPPSRISPGGARRR